MSNMTTIRLCVLWEDELRTASKLLAEAESMPDDAENMSALVAAQERAYHACAIALHGLTDEAHPVLIAATTLRKADKE